MIRAVGIPAAVAWLALGAPAVSAPAAGQDGEAGVVLVGGRVLTLAADGGEVEAVAISGGRIVALGSRAEVVAAAGSGAAVVELGGRTVLPSFVDHHVHLLNVGLALLNRELDEALYLDLSDARTPEEIARRVRERASTLPPGGWILGSGWSQGAWGSARLPEHAPLSAAAPDHPVFLTRVDGHAGWANLRALRLAGIDRTTPDPPGGRIVRTAEELPTGVLLERANEPLLALLPPPADDVARRAFRLAAEAMAAQGVTELYDAGFLSPPGVVGLNADLGRLLACLREADATRPLPVRIHLMIPAPSALAEAVLAEPDRYRSISPRLGVTHLKLFADGAMGSRGAALSHPFADDPTTHGVQRMTADEIAAWSLRAVDAGLDVATHAIGDLAVRHTQEAYARLLTEHPDLDPGRLRIEHYSYAAGTDMRRAAELGIVLSIQPNFVAPEADGRTMEDARVGAENAGRVYAWGTLHRLGARLALGSDYFTAPGPPLLTLHSAVTRRSLAGPPAAGWHPSERLPRRDALRLLISRVPPGGGAEERALRAGERADLVVLSHDPLATDDGDLLGLGVHATLRGGLPVFDDGSLAGLSRALLVGDPGRRP